MKCRLAQLRHLGRNEQNCRQERCLHELKFILVLFEGEVANKCEQSRHVEGTSLDQDIDETRENLITAHEVVLFRVCFVIAFHLASLAVFVKKLSNILCKHSFAYKLILPIHLLQLHQLRLNTLLESLVLLKLLVLFHLSDETFFDLLEHVHDFFGVCQTVLDSHH